MRQISTLKLAVFLGLPGLILVGCGDSNEVGEFDAKGPYTVVQKLAISNCLDLAKRSAKSFGYSVPAGKPQTVSRSGAHDYVVTWTLASKPNQYQCIINDTGKAHKYFWG